MAWTTPATATVGQVLTAAWLNTYVRDNLNALYPLTQITTEVDVVNTAAETNLISYSVAAGAMGTTRRLKVLIIGDYLNNSGAARTGILKIKFGGTTIVEQNSTPAINAHANRRPVRFDFDIANLAAANVNFLEGEFRLGSVGTAAVSGIGDVGVSTDLLIASLASNGTTAIDTASAQTVAVTWQHSAANASLSMRLKYAAVQVI